MSLLLKVDDHSPEGTLIVLVSKIGIDGETKMNYFQLNHKIF
jgi:hypothetical protein